MTQGFDVRKLSEKVLYCFGIYQPLHEEMERELPFITFHSGVPTETDLVDLSDEYHCNIVVLDDLIEYVSAFLEIESLFVKGIMNYFKQNLFCEFDIRVPLLSIPTQPHLLRNRPITPE